MPFYRLIPRCHSMNLCFKQTRRSSLPLPTTSTSKSTNPSTGSSKTPNSSTGSSTSSGYQPETSSRKLATNSFSRKHLSRKLSRSSRDLMSTDTSELDSWDLSRSRDSTSSESESHEVSIFSHVWWWRKYCHVYIEASSSSVISHGGKAIATLV